MALEELAVLSESQQHGSHTHSSQPFDSVLEQQALECYRMSVNHASMLYDREVLQYFEQQQAGFAHMETPGESEVEYAESEPQSASHTNWENQLPADPWDMSPGMCCANRL